MTHCLSNNLDEINELQLIKENAKGFGIPEYSFPVQKGVSAPYWAYKRKRKLKPEAVVSMFLEDHGFVIMDAEGELIRNLYHLMCLIAYEENENGPMIIETENEITRHLRSCFITAPSYPFTLEHIDNLLTSSSINEVIKYLEIFGQLLFYKKPPRFQEKELDIIKVFLKAFTLERLLAMFKLALPSNTELNGWPDITAIKDNCVYFIEVKTTDSLTKRQKDWLATYNDSLDLDYRIIRLVQTE